MSQDKYKFIEQIKLHEGLRLRMYKCTAGKNTIGYGFNLDDNEIPEEVADTLLLYKLADIEESLSKHGLLSADHNDARKGVLMNMAYQMGVTGLLRFKNMIAAYRAQDYRSAGEEMMDSVWATKTPNRAKFLTEQMITGEWQ